MGIRFYEMKRIGSSNHICVLLSTFLIFDENTEDIYKVTEKVTEFTDILVCYVPNFKV